MSPLELVDDRFEKLAEELRASRPAAPATLRAQVRKLEPPEPRWTFGRPSRRVVLAVAALALLGSVLAAGITGLSRSGEQRSSDGRFRPTLTVHGNAVAPASIPFDLNRRSTEGALKAAPDLPAPTASRLQRYEATLRVRVKDVEALSRATTRAIVVTRSLGGYVGSVQYATRGGERGGATLVLRVPVGGVQTALARLTALGTILQQRTGILDVTRRADREAEQIASLERQLRTAPPAQAAAIRHRLATLRAKHARLLKSARFARITLGLTTPEEQPAAAPGRLHRTLDGAGGVLLRELEILLYALVVAGPLLLLGAAGVAAGRTARRRSDARLLERV
ncbi:MAG TPA: DUF4349 domain-containing protein [Gaiellaceae bacterium]|nr:DUF4349 domain-containing protein [Gaiellaceae bacterium]